MSDRRRAWAGSLVGLALAGAGCSIATPIGSINTLNTGGPSYLAGRASQVFPTSENFVEQVKGAMEDVKVRGIVRRQDRETMTLEGTGAGERRITVWVRPEDDGAKMHVWARYGTFGDEALSRAFLDRIARRVGALPGEAKPGPSEATPQLQFRSNSAEAPPGSLFQRRLEGGIRELPYS